MPHQLPFKIKHCFVSASENGKTDEKTSDFLIRFRSQRPSSRAVGFKSPED